jgi:hypothetical protein
MRHSIFKNVPYLFFALLLTGLMVGCKTRKARMIKSPPHYGFSAAQTSQTIKIDLKLKEISGLAWDGDKDEFLAHYDEAGKLYILDKINQQHKD